MREAQKPCEKCTREFVGWEKLIVGKPQWDTAFLEKVVCEKLVASTFDY